MKRNFVLQVDSGKAGYADLYPENVSKVFMYIGSRDHNTTFFGLQYYLMEYLKGKVFTQEDIAEADEILCKHFEGEQYFSRRAWEKLYEKHGGTLPIEIYALPEGKSVPRGYPYLTIENTDPEFPWLVNHVQSLLTRLWFPINAATILDTVKKQLSVFCTQSSDIGPNYMLHDASYRSQTSEEQSALYGAAFLLFFGSSDNLAGIRLLREYYDADIAGIGIPQVDSSAIVAYGSDKMAIEKALDTIKTLDLSVNVDTWDYTLPVSAYFSGEFLDKVKARAIAGKNTIIKLDNLHNNNSLEWILDVLSNKFGSEKNTKKYNVLGSNVRIMLSGSDKPTTVLQNLQQKIYQGWAAENFIIAVEPESVDRNYSQLYAAVSAVELDDGTIFSTIKNKRYTYAGKIYVDTNWEVLTQEIYPKRPNNMMNLVFRNGEILWQTDFKQIASDKR